jgi:pyridoxal phosphate enzyme (YggS family)
MEPTPHTVIERVAEIRRRIAAAAKRSGRNPKDICLIAVGKTHDAATLNEGVRAGILHLGESKVQEAKEKIPQVAHAIAPLKIQWHFIGHLQTNKVRQAVELFDMIHSIDAVRLAAEVDRRSYTKDKTMPILIQVNTSREKSKYGIDPDEVLNAVKQIAELKNVKIKGLMTIGALTASTANDTDMIRSYFRKLRELKEFIIEQRIPNVDMDYLSMGMSGDFELAVEEGATHIRVGTAIFGKRKRASKTLPAAAPINLEENH